MGILGRLRQRMLAARKTEEALYSIVAREMEGGIRHDGLWFKALHLANGSNDKHLAEYIKLRVQSLRDDLDLVPGSGGDPGPTTYIFDVEKCISLIERGEPVSMLAEYIAGAAVQPGVRLIDATDACDDSLLHIALKSDRLDVLEWLLENGANCSAKNFWGKTPLAMARSQKSRKAVNLIEKHSN
jgi:hypothetical protein